MTALLATVAATRSVYATLRRKPPGGSARWARTNHAGRTVDLYGGLAAATGTVLATAAAPGLPVRSRTAAALAVLAAGGCGAYDDLAGTPGERGFRAHMGALQEGRVTSGAVKLFGIGAAGLAAGALLKERPADRLLAGVVVAGTAHLVNLVDVRPGRARRRSSRPVCPGCCGAGPQGHWQAHRWAPRWPYWRAMRGSARCWVTPGRMRWARR
jgi:UDP-N-acetylmuramyl pentapeptide phosphotransferase/UDP-N-acetylglucosamine-1-phosphate transferase